MDRDTILAALTALGVELQAKGIVADLYVVGGAAIALAYDERRSTRDVDAVFAPKTEVYRAAAAVADRLGLPPAWLNDAVKGFLQGPDRWPTELIELPGLRVEVASAQAVLVLKALAHRSGEDDEDLRLLAGQLRLDADGVLALVEETAGPRWLTPQVRFFVEAALDPGVR